MIIDFSRIIKAKGMAKDQEKFRTSALGWIHWGILSCLEKITKDSGKSLQVLLPNHFDSAGKPKVPSKINIELKIEGHEIPFAFFLQRLHASFEDAVAKDAQDLIEHRINKKIEDFDDTMDLLQEKIKCVMEDMQDEVNKISKENETEVLITTEE